MKLCSFCPAVLSARDRRAHRCGDRLEIVNADGARTLAKWPGGDLLSWMQKYVALLISRDMPANTLPGSARIVTRGGRALESWAA